MHTVSTRSQENSTEKTQKVIRSNADIGRKVIAIEELIASGKSARESANLIDVPNSTAQYWRSQTTEIQSREVDNFLITNTGKEFLRTITLAAAYAVHYEKGGIRAMQTFLRMSKLDAFVAKSYGALHEFYVRIEKHIQLFGAQEEKKMIDFMKNKNFALAKIKQSHQENPLTAKRKIIVALDELFRKRQPCLVAMDPVSGYKILEKFTKDRKAETWDAELSPRLETLECCLEFGVGDLCGALKSHVESQGATHIPDHFHIVYEITKATAGGLASQEREFQKLLDKAEENLKKEVQKPNPNPEKIKEAEGIRNLRKDGLIKRQQRCKRVKDAKKELGRINHPIDLTSGKLKTTEEIKNQIEAEMVVIEDVSKEAGLSDSCMKRLEKSKRAFSYLLSFIPVFFVKINNIVSTLELDKEQEILFDEVIFPLCYFNMIWKRQSRKERKRLSSVREALISRKKDSQFSPEVISDLEAVGKECAEKYQRSSSCVEGRNGGLSFQHHRYHSLNPRTLNVHTIIDNFQIRRSDNTTAAERFFGCRHADLFESLLSKVEIPGPPQKQYHDPEKRRIGWEKRRAAAEATAAA